MGEMEAVSKPLAVLSSDESHDLFTKTFNPSLLQKESSMHSERRALASKLLSNVAHKTNNPRLATLAVRVRLDAFTRVKKAIDDMVAQLLKEKEDEKQLAEFNEEEKDALEAISALKAAVTVLSKHNSLLQIPKSHMDGVAASVQNQMQKHASLLAGVLTHAQRKAIASFVQSPEDYFDAAPTFKQSYAPQSGEIFGILKQMKETFETNLSASQKEELANQKAYEELKAAKEDEIAAGQAQLDTKTQELASTDEKNAQAKQDIEDTKASLSADEQFLLMLKEKCSLTDSE